MKILLVEPNYKNKYPPMGLMKISTYHKQRGDKVVFFKGIMKEEEFKNIGFDRVYITSLFTFYYSQTIKTIKDYQKLLPATNIYVGGIMASLMTERLKGDIGTETTILTGLLTDSVVLALDDHINIDVLSIDFSILDDITYKYPAGDNYFAYISRGCTNKCKFCAVPILEPEFCLTNNLSNQISTIKEEYGEKQNLLLLDNNILSFTVEELEKIVEDIYNLGFDKKTKYYEELPLKVYLKRLNQCEKNSTHFQNILSETIIYLHDKIKLKKSKVYHQKYLEIIEELDKDDDKYQVIAENQAELMEILEFYHRTTGRRRCVDFNQGMDARQLTPEKMKVLSQIPIEPFRLAFDNIKYTDVYTRAMKIANNHEVRNFSNYILYNFEDKPEELWQRLKINVDLAKELKVKIFSFPMKYAPIDRIDRKYIGVYWNKQYLRNIYAILNVTKGIVADGESFFYKAYGNNIEEYFEILSMPKEFVTYRKHFEDNGLAIKWQDLFRKLSVEEKKNLYQILSDGGSTMNAKINNILPYYNIMKEMEK